MIFCLCLYCTVVGAPKSYTSKLERIRTSQTHAVTSAPTPTLRPSLWPAPVIFLVTADCFNPYPTGQSSTPLPTHGRSSRRSWVSAHGARTRVSNAPRRPPFAHRSGPLSSFPSVADHPVCAYLSPYRSIEIRRLDPQGRSKWRRLTSMRWCARVRF